MIVNLVKNVTYTCPDCGTSINFDVKPNSDEIRELFNAVDNLIYPKCKEDLSCDAGNTLRAIHEYNLSAQKLISIQKESGAKLD